MTDATPSSKNRCRHLQLQRARDDNDTLIDLWYCPEPNCNFEMNAHETRSNAAPGEIIRPQLPSQADGGTQSSRELASQDFDKDLKHLIYLRAKYDARNEDVKFLFGFIDNLWREYSRANDKLLHASGHETSADAKDAARFRWLQEAVDNNTVVRVFEHNARVFALRTMIDIRMGMESSEKASAPQTEECPVCGEWYERNNVDAVQHVCRGQNGTVLQK